MGNSENDLRIKKHPILGDYREGKRVKIVVNGKEISAYEGEPIAAALLAAGIHVFRRTRKRNDPRGPFCGIGLCTDCVMEVNGKPNVRTCVTPVEEGMTVKSQAWDGDAPDK